MNVAHISKIVIPENRQRTEFPAAEMTELRQSINRLGLMQAPVLREESGTLILVAGERRFRAMSELHDSGCRIQYDGVLLPLGNIPYTLLSELSELEAFEAELDENIKRADLSWQDRARAESQLHELRNRQHESQGLPPQTLTATASEILAKRGVPAEKVVGGSIGIIADRIRLAEHLNDPAVSGAKSASEALKIIKKQAEAKRVEGLAKEFTATHGTSTPHVLLRGDSRTQLATLEDASVDVLLTDPPYGIDADTFGEQSGAGHSYADSEPYFNELTNNLAEESYRVTKEKAHAYVFCDPRRFADLSLAFELAGWKVWPIPLIWSKGNGMLPRPDHAPRRTYETIMFASKGDKLVRAVKPDVINVSGVRGLLHGAQKPVDLYVDLLSRSAVPGDTVLDPFAGSGTIFPAANRAKCKAIGVELSEAYANIATLRMAETEDETETEVDEDELFGVL